MILTKVITSIFLTICFANTAVGLRCYECTDTNGDNPECREDFTDKTLQEKYEVTCGVNAAPVYFRAILGVKAEDPYFCETSELRYENNTQIIFRRRCSLDCGGHKFGGKNNIAELQVLSCSNVNLSNSSTTIHVTFVLAFLAVISMLL